MSPGQERQLADLSLRLRFRSLSIIFNQGMEHEYFGSSMLVNSKEEKRFRGGLVMMGFTFIIKNT